jgi:hypothetical protein
VSPVSVGVCHLATSIPNGQKYAYNGISPAESVSQYFRKIGRSDIEERLATSTVDILEQPAVGQIEDEGTLITRHGKTFDTGIRMFSYRAQPNYEGIDKAAFLVGIGGLKVRVVYRFVVAHSNWGGTDGYDPYEDPNNCPSGAVWKISYDTNVDATERWMQFSGINWGLPPIDRLVSQMSVPQVRNLF